MLVAGQKVGTTLLRSIDVVRSSITHPCRLQHLSGYVRKSTTAMEYLYDSCITETLCGAPGINFSCAPNLHVCKFTLQLLSVSISTRMLMWQTVQNMHPRFNSIHAQQHAAMKIHSCHHFLLASRSRMAFAIEAKSSASACMNHPTVLQIN